MYMGIASEAVFTEPPVVGELEPACYPYSQPRIIHPSLSNGVDLGVVEDMPSIANPILWSLHCLNLLQWISGILHIQ